MDYQFSAEPGPGIRTKPLDISTELNDGDFEYFRSLPDHALESLYPRGIRPLADLGPATPYDRYDQFHQAILYLVAGVPLANVMRIGDFDTDDKQFVKHLAVFCAKSLDYNNEDFWRVRAQLLAKSCSHFCGDSLCLQCSQEEFITIAPGNGKTKQVDSNRDSDTFKQFADQSTKRVSKNGSISPDWRHQSTKPVLRVSCETIKFKIATLLRLTLLLIVVWSVYAALLSPLWLNKIVSKPDGGIGRHAQLHLHADRSMVPDLKSLVDKYHGEMEAILREEYGGNKDLLEKDHGEMRLRHALEVFSKEFGLHLAAKETRETSNLD